MCRSCRKTWGRKSDDSMVNKRQMKSETNLTSQEGSLSPYRVLDLTDENGLLGARILADLGADTIVVEPPGGNHARRLGPFYHDIPHLEKSLFWFALNTNKRGITLGIKTADGRDIF